MKNLCSSKTSVPSAKAALLLQIATPAIILTFVWLWFLVRIVFDFDLIAFLKRNEPASISITLNVTLFFTALLVLWGVCATRKTLGVLRHGVPVSGRVTSIGALTKHGISPVRYEYQFNGRTFYGAADLATEDALRFRAHGEIPLIVNSEKPAKSIPRSELEI